MDQKEAISSYRQKRRFSLQTEVSSDRDLEPCPHYRFRFVPNTLTPVMRNWKKVRVFARAVGAWMLLLREIRKFGVAAKTDLIAPEEDCEVLVVPSRLLLLPSSLFLKFWASCTALMLIFSAFYIPYQVCFNTEELEMTGTDYFIEVWFLTDILVTFFVAYENKLGLLETSHRKIAKKYLKGWFLFDLVACFPFHAIDFSEGKNYNGLLRLLRLPRLYRLVRVLRIVKMLQGIAGSDIMESVMRGINLHGGVLRLLRFSFMVVIIVHVAGCFWYFLAWLYDFEPNTWVVRAQRQEDSAGTLYLVSIYWVFTVITTVGFGDIVAANSTERIYAIIVMGVGIAFYSYTISNISSVLASMNQRDLEYKTTLSAIKDFSAETNLPKNLRDSVISQVKHNYEANINSWYSKDKLLSELPTHLRTQVSANIHKALVSELAFFQNKDPGFISFVVPRLKSVAYTIGDLIYRVGDYASETFFLLKGEVILKDEYGVGFKTYMKGSYFGEIEVLKRCLRAQTCQVIALKAECLVLAKDQLREVMEEFPAVAEEIIEYAQSRDKRNFDAMRFAHMTLNSSTLRRIAKKATQSNASSSHVSWTGIKQQYATINLIDRRLRSRSGSLTPVSPVKPNVRKHRATTDLLFEDPSSTRSSTQHLSGSATLPVHPDSLSPPLIIQPCGNAEKSRKKIMLPLPNIPSMCEDSLLSYSENVKLQPQVDLAMKEFGRRDALLQHSLEATIGRLEEVYRRQQEMEKKTKEIMQKLRKT